MPAADLLMYTYTGNQASVVGETIMSYFLNNKISGQLRYQTECHITNVILNQNHQNPQMETGVFCFDFFIFK